MFNANEMHRVSSERESLSILPTDVVAAIEVAAKSGKYSCEVPRKVSSNASFIDTDQLQRLKNLGFAVGVKIKNKRGHHEHDEDPIDSVIYTINW